MLRLDQHHTVNSLSQTEKQLKNSLATLSLQCHLPVSRYMFSVKQCNNHVSLLLEQKVVPSTRQFQPEISARRYFLQWIFFFFLKNWSLEHKNMVSNGTLKTWSLEYLTGAYTVCGSPHRLYLPVHVPVYAAAESVMHKHELSAQGLGTRAAFGPGGCTATRLI